MQLLLNEQQSKDLRDWLSVTEVVPDSLKGFKPKESASGYPETPELDKMLGVSAFSNALGAFMDWLTEDKGIQFGKAHHHGPGCHGWDEETNTYNPKGDDRCAFQTGEHEALIYRPEELLAEYFGIDLRTVEKERRGILEYLRTRT